MIQKRLEVWELKSPKAKLFLAVVAISFKNTCFGCGQSISAPFADLICEGIIDTSLTVPDLTNESLS